MQRGGAPPDGKRPLFAAWANQPFGVRRDHQAALAFRAVRPQRRVARRAVRRHDLERAAKRRLAVLAGADVAVEGPAAAERGQGRDRQRLALAVARHRKRAVAKRHHRLRQGRFAQRGAAAVVNASADVGAQALLADAQLASGFRRQFGDEFGDVRRFHGAARAAEQIDEQRLAARRGFLAGSPGIFLCRDHQGFRHAGVGRERAIRIAGRRHGDDHDVAVVAGEQIAHRPPRRALQASDGQHESQTAARLHLHMPQVHEVGRQPRVAVADWRLKPPAHCRQPLGHRPLLLHGGAESGKGRHRHVGDLVIRRARERRVHDDQIHRIVGQVEVLHLHVVVALGLALAGGKERAGLPGGDEVQGADGNAAPLLFAAADAVGHGVDAGVGEHFAWMDAGKLRRAQMRCRRHDVRGDHRAFQHRRMDAAIVAAGAPEAGEQRMVGRHQQRAGAAGEVGDAQVRVGIQIGPVGRQPGHGEFAEQGCGLRPRVERGEELPVRDQALEHAPGEILLGGQANPGKLVGCARKRPQRFPARHAGKRRQQIRRQAEDRPIVDLGKHMAPRLQYRRHPLPVWKLGEVAHRRQIVG